MRLAAADYQPDDRRDRELAVLAFAAVRGWPDQRPITPSLVRSRLRSPTSAAATIIVTCRNQGELVGAAALRPPNGPAGLGRLWGPVVHPDLRRTGLATQLLTELGPALALVSPAKVSTAEIPTARTRADVLFTRARWLPGPSATLLKRPLPAPPAARHQAIRTLASDPCPPAALGELFAAVRPAADPHTAAATFDRWTADERFTPDGLLFLTKGTALLAAALVYPLAHVDPAVEPTEALLADLLIDPTATAQGRLRATLVAAALHSGHLAGASVARAVVPIADTATQQTLVHAGFTRITQLRTYLSPDPTRASDGSS